MDERKSWSNVFDCIKETFELTTEELNKDKYREVFVNIEKWAYYDRLRRSNLKEPEEFRGCLWDGKE